MTRLMSCLVFAVAACLAATLPSRERPRAAEIAVADHVAAMQVEAEQTGTASWGHWGDEPERYVAWSNHSNRLIPVYAFGISLSGIDGPQSIYRDAERLAALYGRLPEATLNPDAEYFDQTDVYALQAAAADAGWRRIVLVVFDGLDWTTTRTAAIVASGTVAYDQGRGTGLSILDYEGVKADFGFCVTSPANDGTEIDVDAQVVVTPGGKTPGGYDAALGGATPWDPLADATYLTGKHRTRPHAVTDSAASATSLCTGIKTYNDAINVDVRGRQFEPIARILQKQGWATGVVSSVPIPHATPACGYANNVTRDDYQDITRDMVGERSISHRSEPLPGLDVVIGCGFGVNADADGQQGRNYEPGNKYVAASTLAAIDAAGGGRYELALRTAGRDASDVLEKAAERAIASGRRLFGFFGTAEGNLPFATADGRFDPVTGKPEDESLLADSTLRRKYSPEIRYSPADLAENPTLAEMTTAALDVLGAKDRFWLMVEAGDVDWASHANNIDGSVGAVLSGDEAFRAITTWIESHGGWDKTAVIVTGDHGHMFVLTEPKAFTGK
jgi:alkaline phosphatase